MMFEDGILTSIFVVAIALLGILTAGVGYLTYVDWRDRQERKKR